MATKRYKAITPGLRQRVTLDYTDLSKVSPQKSLLKKNNNYAGRSNGKISVRFRGGRIKRKYRVIDFFRKPTDLLGQIETIEYDPNRGSNICLVNFKNGDKKYIIQPKGLLVGDQVSSNNKSDIRVGNALEIQFIPTGTDIHNIELRPGRGAQLARSAGAYATLTAKNVKYVTIKLPSGEIRLIPNNCIATIGQVSNFEKRNTRIGKAGIKRKSGKRSEVRGAAMNPCDHPHGGGEGKAPVGLSGPVSPKGKKALGKKTRKRQNRLILSRRK
eukprot:COSAG01_NODE_1_length_100484_cov_170.446142_88_plen_272_part_00